MNGHCIDVAFPRDFSVCYAIASDGSIYKWNLETFKCEKTLQDHSNAHPTRIAVSPNSDYLAVGYVSEL